ncbi:MAG TPA: hypothetical protein PKA49_02715 [Tepidiformaceae bacterium]|nr:hypothetical protein [Tepidiformaceae bacterium]
MRHGTVIAESAHGVRFGEERAWVHALGQPQRQSPALTVFHVESLME